MIEEIKILLINMHSIVLVLIIIIGTFIIAKLIKRILERTLKRTYVNKLIPPQYLFLKHFAIGLIYMIGIGIAVYLIPPLRAISVSIFASAGVLAIVIGFAAQQAFSNIISGIFIAIFKPFRVGDRIKIKTEIVGIVEDITIRHTVIRTFENKRIIIPNSVMGSEIIENSSLGDEKICRFVELGISYD